MARVEDPDARLVERFETFYTREYPKMVALAAAIAGRLAAEDLAQEALVRAHRDWRRVGAFDRPGAWVRRVTINLSTSTVRRRSTEAKARLKLAFGQQTAIPAPSLDHEPVWDAVRKLPGKQRAAVALFYLEDRSVADIADILNCTPATAKVHLHRGRQTLADTLDRFGGSA